ncbi:calcium-binding mitochondrial carrier SAL1 [Verticillium alfalfae VaMs.102]|uniref:Mitochondrial thiamine pyrophosphate carrier 1 n=1 Tax=Verticillium alfalfae (strain VaMs.102 / ATCC MYA-4576 / FGSC 10136) TaxID=526221 RepID=C9SFB3_VERA1|nr:calcium-binding mitochondrial carrier SAL1 [Verticillium alfalfae VaMs.102]EEY17899.1 calcium-binding mitochondrial carrier SAL1 [Verticillium alfalfae VaMs.102]
MGVTRLVSELELGWIESQNQRDKRMEELWAKLDTQKSGFLDFKGLQRGLKRIDHPMKNAGEMMRQILSRVDTNEDGRIDYEEFRTFVEQTEKQLLILFHSIDRDNNGKLDKAELQAAFKRAGLVVPMRKLDAFFNDIDLNNDGYITFGEWRDFLLFMPVHHGNAPLEAVLSYYSSIVTLTAEGDSMVSEETLEGLDDNVWDVFKGVYEDGVKKRKELARMKNPLPCRCRRWRCLYEDATAPLDRLKVYLLVNTKSSADTALAALKQGRPLVALANAGKPFGDAFRDLWQAGGMRSLFAGNGLNVIKIMPESAIKFGSYEAAKRALAKLEGHDDPKRINSYSKFTAGGIAGMVAQFCVYPLDTLKFRLQTSTVQGGLTGNALVIDTAKKMWLAGGFRSAYRGVTMGLIGMFPYSAIDMGTFELLKTSYKKYAAQYQGIHEEDAKPGNIVTGIIGATSGAFGATVVYPLNVLRTRLQTQGTAMHPATYTGIWDVAQKTLKNEGMRGMYKGLTPNLLKVAPALSITWVMYENSKRMLGLE